MHPLLAEKGYTIFPQVVPSELCEAVVRDIEVHTEGGKWGGNDHVGLVEMYHYQSMWDVRQLPEVHKCFSLLFGTEDLWVTLDRVCRKPPVPDQDWNGFLHWDLNPNIRPRVREVQGLVALADTDEKMGGFHCAPSLYRELDCYLETLPTRKIIRTGFLLDSDGSRAYEYGQVHANACWSRWIDERPPRKTKSWPIERVPLRQGDLLVFDSYLPHGNGCNRSKKVRYAQYVSMIPEGDERTRLERIASFSTNSPPSGLAFFGDPRNLEEKKAPAKLTELGMRLLGMLRWSDSLSEWFAMDPYALCSL